MVTFSGTFTKLDSLSILDLRALLHLLQQSLKLCGHAPKLGVFLSEALLQLVCQAYQRVSLRGKLILQSLKVRCKLSSEVV